jgi:hypothetical protein
MNLSFKDISSVWAVSKFVLSVSWTVCRCIYIYLYGVCEYGWHAVPLMGICS